jgi:hypothetical protein
MKHLRSVKPEAWADVAVSIRLSMAHQRDMLGIESMHRLKYSY